MDSIQLATAALCALVGLSLGLLGGGGSVLMVPLFVYVAKVPVNEAIAMSLMIVGLSAALGAVKYLRQGFINRRLVVLFVLPGSAASFFGARTAQFVASEHLLLMFGSMMMLIAVIIYARSAEGAVPDGPLVCRPALALSATAGAVIGFLTGLLGVGGGFLIVPAIALLMKCSLRTAIGTSLAVIAVNSATGFAGHLSAISFDIPSSMAFLAATLGGTATAAKFSDRLSGVLLQRGFAMLIFFIGLLVAVQEIPFVSGRE